MSVLFLGLRVNNIIGFPLRQLESELEDVSFGKSVRDSVVWLKESSGVYFVK
jgi:hypothetical protein